MDFSSTEKPANSAIRFSKDYLTPDYKDSDLKPAQEQPLMENTKQRLGRIPTTSETKFISPSTHLPIHPSARRYSDLNIRNNLIGQPVRVKYQDFYPEFHKKNLRNEVWIKSTDFKSIIESVNKWLSENPGFEPKSCESVTWASDDVRDLVIPGDLMVTSLCLEEDKPTFYILGLRVWYVISTSTRSMSLSVLEFIPMATDSTIQDLVRQIDTDLKSDQILNLETVALPLLPDHMDNNLTTWTEVMDNNYNHAYFLRLFLLKGRNANEKTNTAYYSHLSVMDFVPRLTADDVYEGFADLVERCNRWCNNSITLINLQSVFAKQDPVNHENTGNSCFFEKPGLNFRGSIDYFRILRVVYVTSDSGVKADQMENNNVTKINLGDVPPIMYEIFTPDVLRGSPVVGEKGQGLGRRVKGQMIEGMAQTFSKMAEFIYEADIEIVNMEMVSNPVQFRCDENIGKNSLKFLYSIRLFYRLHNLPRSSRPQGISRKHPQIPGQAKPGPIFLKNVVNRKFPYRWLILSLSAFASMTVIVVISVIYSNK